MARVPKDWSALGEMRVPAAVRMTFDSGFWPSSKSFFREVDDPEEAPLGSDESLGELLTVADSRMYEQKRERYQAVQNRWMP